MIALLIAAAIDRPASQWAHEYCPLRSAEGARLIFWWLGHALTLCAVALILAVWHPDRWRAGLLLLLSGGAGAFLYSVMKWVVGRTRPFKGVGAFELQPFCGELAGLFHTPKNLAFPSGHACLAFAMAACLSRLIPSGRIAFFLLATLVGAARVLVGAHYPSDVVAGAVTGILATRLTAFAARRVFGYLPGRASLIPHSRFPTLGMASNR